MATPVYVGNCDFEIIEIHPSRDNEGFDSLQLLVRGKDSSVSSFAALWIPGAALTSAVTGDNTLQWPTMFIKSCRISQAGPFASASVEATGFLDRWRSATATPYRTTYEVSLQSATITTTQDESISVSFYGDVKTSAWIQVSPQAPRSPKFPITSGSDIPIGAIIDASPSNYKGTPEYKTIPRLAQFSVEEIAPGVWGVQESWERRMEAFD